jgi:ABC-type molybdate transport system ATPase subunit
MSNYILFDHNTHTAYISATFKGLSLAAGITKRRVKYLFQQRRTIKGVSVAEAIEYKLSSRAKNFKKND